MTRWGRLLGWAAVWTMAGGGTAAAQTVVVRHVPADAAVEASMDAGAPVAAARDDNGNFKAGLNAITGTGERAANIYLDDCQARRRVVIVDRQMEEPPTPADCTRQQVGGTFVIRATTTIVVDVRPSTPRLLIAQGPPPDEWLHDVVVSGAPKVFVSPSGVMIFGTADLAHFSDALHVACGSNVPSCDGSATRPGATAGAAWWITPNFGAEAAYSSPSAVDITGSNLGSGDTYNFTSVLKTELVTVAGVVGVPIRRVTFFGIAGAAHHRTTWTTNQVVTASTVTAADGTSQTLAGGTETWKVQVNGWHWLAGGGANIWLSEHLAMRAAFEYTRLQGKDINGSGATIDQVAPMAQLGLVLRFGG